MNKQKGFSAVIVLLIILVLGAVGFAGYYVYKQQGKNTTNNSTNVPTAQTEQKQPETPAPNLKDYITFNEMGVKAPKESLNSNIYYVYDSSKKAIKINSTATNNYLLDRYKKDTLNNNISEQIESCAMGSAGIISTVTKQDILDNNHYLDQESINLLKQNNLAKDFGDYYIIYTGPQSPCSDIVFEDENLYANQPIESAKKFFNSFTIL